MTERRLTESAIGLAGRLSRIPYGTEKAEDCGWHSSRNFTRNAPVFRALGPSKTWILPDSDHATGLLPLPGTLWEQNRRQQKWLMKNHPEASLGNQILHDYLPEEDPLISSQQEQSWHTCLFSLGELTDTTLQRNSGVSLLVTVTGSAKNTLRLATLEHETWTWPREPNVTVRLTEAPIENPTLWIGEEVGPIHRVKCIVDLKRYQPTRWLAVQRNSGTTIFQPEARKVLVDGSIETYTSRIAANPLFHLSKDQTGGNAHSDVSFNPGTRSNRPQLAIIDERGFWSIWDVRYPRLKHSSEAPSKLRLCGHIHHGVLDKLPHTDRSSMRWHKILWVGRSDNDLELLSSLELDADNKEPNSQAAFPPLQRSSLLLLCNSQQVKLLDLTTDTYLPDLVFRRQDSLDCILDIQPAHDPQYFYVLTTSKLFVVRAYSRLGAEWDKPEKVWLILFSTPHFRSSFDQSLRLAITQGAKPDVTTSLVFIHSSTNPWTDLFYVEFSPIDPNRVTCQANVTGLGSLQSTALNSVIRSLCINPPPITVKAPESLSQIGRGLAARQVRIYQIAALRPDMSLVSALCVFSWSSATQISVPSIKVGRSKRRALQRLSSNFVVDDDLTTSEEDSQTVAQRYIKEFCQHLSSIYTLLDNDSPTRSANRGSSSNNPFDAAHHSIQEGLDSGLLPLRTLLQVMPSFKEVPRHSLSAVEWETEIGGLNEIHSSVIVYTLGLPRSRLYFSIPTSLKEAYRGLFEISNSSLHHGDSEGANEGRMAAISQQIAYDLYLSFYGISYNNLGISQSQAAAVEDMPPDSQAETLPSSPLRFESPASTPRSSQWSNSEAAEDEDPAMSLLRAYTGTGQFVAEKKFELLDKWRLGAEPSEYIFDLDRSDDAAASKSRKAKQLAREDRKRRRAQTLLQLSQEPELPATQPAPDTSFFSSQPRFMSSQVIHSDPLHMMSQPSAGPFGRRPTKKRKGGF
ncbi:RNA polymerase I-specific transcription initiation factor RRN6-like protein [Hypoxylon argillaceum]|nr:RNA polymerase I-specific transcription initiation factor RRN6-like protein [Hypoxylon argillaceum]